MLTQTTSTVPPQTKPNALKRGNKPYPNKLKTVVKTAGLTISELSKETNIPRGTLYFWSACKGVIPRWARLKMAHIIGCEPQDLAPYTQTIAHEANQIEQP